MIEDHFSPKLITQSLEVLAACIFQDPDFILSLPKAPRIALIQNTPSGGKFWISGPAACGLALCWGKLGTRGAHKFIPLDKCHKQNPALELKARVLSKLSKGYSLLPQETILP